MSQCESIWFYFHYNSELSVSENLLPQIKEDLSFYHFVIIEKLATIVLMFMSLVAKFFYFHNYYVISSPPFPSPTIGELTSVVSPRVCFHWILYACLHVSLYTTYE